jgi:hypothetical protein
MMRAMRWSWVASGLQNSVFRRSIILYGFLVPGFVANFLLIYFAAHWLSAADFGVFYVAITVSGTLFSGAAILNIFFTRHLVAAAHCGGKIAAVALFQATLRKIIFWGGCASVATVAILLLVGYQIGAQSWLIILLIVAEAFTSYIADFGRALPQSTYHVVSLGLYGLSWMVLRFLFCAFALIFFHSVWTALSALVLVNALVFVGFCAISMRGIRPATTNAMPSPFALLSVAASYGVVIILCNLDVLLSYLLLANKDIGVYSASSVFPKAILTITMPLQQMLFALAVGGHHYDQNTRRIVAKSGVTILVICSVAVSGIWLTSDLICGGRWGLNLCRTDLMHPLLLSVFPLVMIRFLVLLHLTQERDLFGLWLLLPVLVYAVAAAALSPHKLRPIAIDFSLCMFGTLIFVALIPWCGRMKIGSPAPKRMD